PHRDALVARAARGVGRRRGASRLLGRRSAAERAEADREQGEQANFHGAISFAPQLARTVRRTSGRGEEMSRRARGEIVARACASLRGGCKLDRVRSLGWGWTARSLRAVAG